MSLDHLGRVEDFRDADKRNKALLEAVSEVFQQASIGNMPEEQKQELAQTVGQAIVAGLKAANVETRPYFPRR